MWHTNASHNQMLWPMAINSLWFRMIMSHDPIWIVRWWLMTINFNWFHHCTQNIEFSITSLDERVPFCSFLFDRSFYLITGCRRNGGFYYRPKHDFDAISIRIWFEEKQKLCKNRLVQRIERRSLYAFRLPRRTSEVCIQMILQKWMLLEQQRLFSFYRFCERVWAQQQRKKKH